jgi:hypothetical protein
MNLLTSIDSYEPQNVLFCETIKNNIIPESDFVRILYSTPIMTINGIYLHVYIDDLSCDKFYNKHKCVFNTSAHKDTITKLKMLEESILSSLTLPDHTPLYKLHDQLSIGNIKTLDHIETSSCLNFVLKISGVWITDKNYGLTYKFSHLKDTLKINQ